MVGAGTQQQVVKPGIRSEFYFNTCVHYSVYHFLLLYKDYQKIVTRQYSARIISHKKKKNNSKTIKLYLKRTGRILNVMRGQD